MMLQVLLLLQAAGAQQAVPLHEYAVTVGAHASEPERFAAAQLAHFLSLVGRSRRHDTVAPSAVTPPLFAVGVEAAASAGVNAAALLGASLRDDGFFCQSSNDLRTIVLTGGTRSCHSTAAAGGCNLTAAQGRGTINAVFEYLRMAGFGFYAVNATRVPPSGAAAVPCSGTHNPSFSWRLVIPAFFPVGAHWPGSGGSDEVTRPLADRSLWAVANHMNGAMEAGEQRTLPLAWGGEPDGYNIAGFVHTSHNIIPATTYPDWYAGSRQPCWTNKSLVAFLERTVTGYLDAFQKTHGHSDVVVSVTQEDSGAECPKLPNGLCYCSTDEERAVIAEEGSPSGPLLRAINSIAAAVEGPHPGAVIETLAYDYTIVPPKITRPRPNVNIFFCTSGESENILDVHALPITHAVNSEMVAVLRQWSSIMPRTGRGILKLWD